MHFGKRAAGILLPVTSLPSDFGIGDLGPEAFRFAEFLNSTHQRYWQMLPLNPVQKQQGFSPYSSFSSIAGNPLLISPEMLAREGFLKKNDLSLFLRPNTGSVNYAEALVLREQMLNKAFDAFQSEHQQAFEDFCHREAYWLDDFALYSILKKTFSDNPWYEWPEAFRFRDLKTLIQFSADHQVALSKIRWAQFIFFRQWSLLKMHCSTLGVRILGDLPFYISYDSTDVWSRPEIFMLDENGGMQAIAGVPPDYFNENGQLWGMPVFRWDVLKEQRFDWWVKRIKKNLELFDLLRLDHFRAFSEYWEVPAGEKTAINGKWKPGPGASLFNVLKQEFSDLPFVAEDLGEISENVYELRDQFKLPGMKVLQFAFGKEMPESDHIPHNYTSNYIAYTGTHDNNTTRGWYCNELDAATREQISQYAGEQVTKKNVHLILNKIVYASVANTVILPVQDLLGLDEKARMNTPAFPTGNWTWRLQSLDSLRTAEELLRKWTTLYGRIHNRNANH